MHIWWNIIQLLKEEDAAIFDNIDGPGGHYAHWNKPDTDWQILYNLTYMWNLKQS